MKAKLSVVEVKDQLDVSAIVPIADRHDDIEEIAREYFKMLTRSGKSFEMIFVLDGMHPAVASTLEALAATYPAIKLLRFMPFLCSLFFYVWLLCMRTGQSLLL